MLSEWGTWQPTVLESLGMPPEIEALLKNNLADFFAIMQIIGVENAAKISPHLIAILKTYQAAKKS